MPDFTNRGSMAGNALLFGLLLSVTLFIKFGLPFGGGGLFLAFFIIWGLTGYGYLSGLLEVHKKRFMIYSVFVGVLLCLQLPNVQTFSITSLAMICLIHAPYIFILKEGHYNPEAETKFFNKLMLFFAVLGIIQFFAQYGIGEWAFFFDTKFPQSWIVPNYHGLNPLTEGVPIYKSTALFMQEPSNFSQLLALAILIELLFFRNWARLGFYFVALSLTFSGTGLIPLIVLTPLYLLLKRKFFTLITLIAVYIAAPLWAPYVGLDKTVNRTTEFVNTNSSGYARFISPARVIADSKMGEDAGAFLTGLGAGSYANVTPEMVDYTRAASTWGKLFYEYGLIGTLFYILFMGYVIGASKKNGFLIAALLIQYIFLGEHLFPPTVHALLLAFLAWPGYRQITHDKKDNLSYADKSSGGTTV